jgi:hypothetical protein
MSLNARHAIALILTIVAAYLLPYHVHPFRAFYQEWMALFALVIALALSLEEPGVRIRLPTPTVVPVALALVVMLQAAFGMLTVAWDAIIPVAYLIGAAGAMIVGATFGAGDSGAARLCRVLAIAHLIAGLISTFLASLQFMGAEPVLGSLVMQFPTRTNIRPFANVGQPNQLALLLCLAIAGVWWLFQDRMLKRASALAASLALLWGLALTQSRIGWLIVPAFAFLLAYWGKERLKPVRLLPAASLAAFYALLVWALPSLASSTGSSTVDPSHRTTMDRIGLIEQALDIARSYPLAGAGWYEFGPEQIAIGASGQVAPYSQHSHNLFLNFAAEVGWPFTLVLAALTGCWFAVTCLRRHPRRETAFGALFLTAVAIHSLVEFPLWYAYVLIPTALLVGMVHQVQFGSIAFGAHRMVVAGLCIVCAVALVAVATDYRRVVVGFRVLGWQMLGLKADEGSMERPRFTIFPHFYDYFDFALKPARPGMGVDEINEAERITRRFGYPPVLMRMSLIYTLNSRADDARRTVLKIRNLHSGHYKDTYEAWQGLADTNPQVYRAIFKALPVPQ